MYLYHLPSFDTTALSDYVQFQPHLSVPESKWPLKYHLSALQNSELQLTGDASYVFELKVAWLYLFSAMKWYCPDLFLNTVFLGDFFGLTSSPVVSHIVLQRSEFQIKQTKTNNNM